MINKYERIKEYGGGNDSDGEEHALYMGGGKFVKKFKGRCHQCGEIGHKGVDCKKENNKGASEPSDKGK